MHNNRKLTVVPSIGVQALSRNKFLLPAKFVSGMQRYAEEWDGIVTAVCVPIETASDNLDNRAYSVEELGFRLVVASPGHELITEELSSSAVVLAPTDYRFHYLAAVCNELQVPCVYNSEYTLKTALQIIWAESRLSLTSARKALWAIRNELRQRKAITLSGRLQANGTPTYESYGKLARVKHLYFDSRLEADDIPLESNAGRTGGPLRLCFSGRLNRMKGAQFIYPIARDLRSRGIDFRFTVCGDGPLRAELQSQITDEQLSNEVELKGVLEFRSELLPELKSNVDLFVCPHPQGDPSCTYLETMGCGVPIAGFANEAFEGISKLSRSGWVSPLNNVSKLCDVIQRLSQERQAIRNAGKVALRFARDNTFLETFRRRIEMLREQAE